MTADDRRPVPPAALHPDLDTLADLHAGALDDSTAERVRRHVTSCPQCAGVLAALDTVGSRLRGLPAPPIPAPVAARLDATLADLRRGTAGPSRVPSGSGRTGEPVERRSTGAPERLADLTRARDRRQRRRSRVFGAAAAAVAVLAAGASVTAIVRAGTGGSDDNTSAAGGAADSGTEASALPDSPGVTIAVPSYDRDTLRTDLPQIVQRSAVSIITGRTDEAGPAGVMSEPGRRTACANTIRGSSGRLQGVLRITYEGRPAYVFVFADGTRRTAYVVPADCGTSAAGPAAVLDTAVS